MFLVCLACTPGDVVNRFSSRIKSQNNKILFLLRYTYQLHWCSTSLVVFVEFTYVDVVFTKDVAYLRTKGPERLSVVCTNVKF